jgi:hypothetical protein
MKWLLPIVAIGFAACSQTRRSEPPASAGFADSITFAYAPLNLQSFADYDEYRQDADVVQETGFIDYSVRNNDFASVEVGREYFPTLKNLAGKGSFSREEIAALPFAKGKFCLFLATSDSAYKTAGTRIKDALQNTVAILGATGTTPILLHDSKEYRHRIHVLYLDPQAGRFVDTTSVMAKSGSARNGWPKMEDGETLPYHHYISVLKALAKK